MDRLDGGAAAEMGMAVGLRAARDIIGIHHGPTRIEFSHKPFGPMREYEAFFHVPVRFEQPHNALVFRAGTLDERTSQSDPSLYRVIENHLRITRERLTLVEPGEDLARIWEAIAFNAERSEFSAEALAKRIGMSLRKLQRLVRAHDTTVRALLEASREAYARQLLSDPRLSLGEVSFLLGYSEDLAFRRAFKRWTGQTPGRFKRATATSTTG